MDDLLKEKRGEILKSLDPDSYGDSVLRSALGSAVASVSSLSDTVVLVEDLNLKEQQLLASNFPEFKLVFKCTVNHPHAFAAASRKLEHRVLLNRLGVPNIENFSGYDDFVCDIGGDFSYYVTNDIRGVHCCCPLLDLRDRQRFVTRCERLQRRSRGADVNDLVSRGNQVSSICKFFSSDIYNGSVVCHNTAQMCDRTARYGIALHSSYDMALGDFAELMKKKKMVELYGSFIFSDKMFVERSGMIDDINCFYNIDEKKGTVEFSFENDPSMVYNHRLCNYFSLLSVNYFHDDAKEFTFVLELLENRSGIQFFKITKLDTYYVEKSVVTRFMWLPSLKGKTRVNFFDIDYDMIAVGNFSLAFKPVSFYVDTSIVDKVTAHAYASTEAKFRPVEIFNFLMAYNGRIFFGSDVCVRQKPLPVFQAMMLANAIYLEVFVKKYDIGKINQLLIAAIKHDRELSEGSLKKKFFMPKFTAPKIFGSGHHSVLKGIRRLLSPLHAFLYWFKKSPYIAHRFLQENVKFLRCDTALVPSRFGVVDVNTNRCNFVHSVPIPEVLHSEASLDIKRILCDVLAQFYKNDQKVVQLQDIVPISFIPRDIVVDVSEPKIYSANVDQIFDSSNARVLFMDKFSTYRRDTINDQCAKFFFPKEFVDTVICATLNNIVLVKQLLSMNLRVFLVGFDTDLLHLFDTSEIPNLRVVECEGVVSVAVLTVALSLGVSNVIVDDSFDCIDVVYNSFLNFKCDKLKIFLRLSTRVTVETFVSILLLSDCSCRNFRIHGFGMFVRLSKPFLLKRRIASLVSFFDHFISLSVSVSSSVTVSSVTCNEETSVAYSSCSSPDSFVTVKPSAVRFSPAVEVDVDVVPDCTKVVEQPSPPSSLDSSDSLLRQLNDCEFGILRDRENEQFLSVKSTFSLLNRSAAKLIFLLAEYDIPFCPVVLDLCAAPGGFTSVMTSLGSSVTALLEPSSKFLAEAKVVIERDIFEFRPLGNFDLVLADGAYSGGCELGDCVEEQIKIFSREVDIVLESGAKYAIVKLAIIPGIDVVLNKLKKFFYSRPLFTKLINREFYVIITPEAPLQNVEEVLFSLESSRLTSVREFVDGVVDYSSRLSEFSECFFKIYCVKDTPSYNLYNTPRFLNLIVDRFTSSLDHTKATRRSGKTGCRYEWLYAPIDYTYSGQTTSCLSSVIPECFSAIPLFSEFNALLVVYYPDSCTGLRFHKDDELEMDSDRVLTFSSGHGCTLLVKHLSSGVVDSVEMDSTKFYLLKDQGDILHAVNTKGSRYALTFRKFKTSLEVCKSSVNIAPVFCSEFSSSPITNTVEDVVPPVNCRDQSSSLVLEGVPYFLLDNPGAGNCLFYALVGNSSPDHIALRKFILKNRPKVLDSPLYVVSEVDEECAKDGVWGGLSTICAFSFIFNAEVTIYSAESATSLHTICFCESPLSRVVLYYSGNHYVRLFPLFGCDVSTVLQPQFSFEIFDVSYLLGVVNRLFSLDGGDCMDRLVSFFRKVDVTPFSVFSPTVHSKRTLFNLFLNQCISDKCCCFNGCCKSIGEFFLSGGTEALLVLPLYYKFFFQLSEFIDSHSLSSKLFVIPGLIVKGVLLLMLTPKKVTDVNVSLPVIVDRVSSHALSCVSCRGSVLHYNPHYNHITRTYYLCSGQDGNKVIFSDSLDNVERIFKLCIVSPHTDPAERDTAFSRGDVVIIPVRVKSIGVLSTNRSDLKKLKKCIDDYFYSNGRFSCIGIENCGIHQLKGLVENFFPYCSKIVILNSQAAVPSSGVEFSPSFVTTVGDESYLVNAMIESREYYRANVSSIINVLKPLHEQYLRVFSDRNGCEDVSTITNNKPDFGLIDMNRGSFLVQPKDGVGPFSYAFDGKNLIDISSSFVKGVNVNDLGNVKKISDWLTPGVFSGLFSVSRDTKLINSQRIYNNLKGIDVNTLDFNTKLELVEGVPGCGKTHYIIQNHSFSLKDTRDIVLTSSREAAADLRRRVSKSFNVDSNNKILKLRYRTVDSFLMHFRKRDYSSIDTIWLDEGLMKHFGDVLWCAVVSKCSKVIIIGDRAQIPFLNRIAGITLNYKDINLSSDRLKVTFLDTTHRCPVDVAALLNSFQVYPSKVLSSSKVRRSLNTILISNVNEIVNLIPKDCQLLTFTQSEKADISKALGRRVFTVNEFQGNQAENVVLVRTNPKDLTVYSSVNHILVALSRHTKLFFYATTVEDSCFDRASTIFADSVLDDCTTDGSSRGGGQVQIYDCNRLRGGGLILGKTKSKQFPMNKVTPRAPTMIDMLKQNSTIRNFVLDNLGSGVVPLRMNLEPIEIPTIEIPVGRPYYVSDTVVTMQYFYDEIFPGHSTIDYSFDSLLFSQDDLYFSTKEMLRFTEYEYHKSLLFDSLTPSLRTTCPSPVDNNVKQVLKAFYDRNGNVPVLQGLTDDDRLADSMYSSFCSAYILDSDLFKNFSSDPVTVNVDSIEDWLYTQSSEVYDQAFSSDFSNIFQRELNSYSLILKKLPKPKLDVAAFGKYPSPQTIAHLTKDVNAVFCPIFREIKTRLISVLRPNALIFSDLSIPDFEEVLTVRLPSSRLNLLKYILEVDMGKYDKSQGRVALLFEVKLLVALGFPQELVSTWIHMHVYTRIVDRINKVVARVFFQRKSGDPWTFCGNTLFLMAVLVHSLETNVPGFIQLFHEDRVFMLFSGDDSLVFSSVPLSLHELSHDLANCFNLESKLLKFSTPYFCSKFLIMTPWGRWVVVPDVVKLLIKLGRRDLINEQHVEEYRISCLDVASHLGNSVLYPLIDCCLIDRYKIKFSSLGLLYSALYCSFSSPSEFTRLYYRRDSARISDRVFRKISDF